MKGQNKTLVVTVELPANRGMSAVTLQFATDTDSLLTISLHTHSNVEVGYLTLQGRELLAGKTTFSIDKKSMKYADFQPNFD